MTIEELRRLSEAATPGPWRAQGGPVDGVDYVLSPIHEEFLTGPLQRPNAAFIVAAVNYVRDGERQRPDRVELREALDDIRHAVKRSIGLAKSTNAPDEELIRLLDSVRDDLDATLGRLVPRIGLAT